MKQLLILSNRLAGDGRRLALLKQASRLTASFNLRHFRTDQPVELNHALEMASPDDTAGIVVFGGDGTVHRLLPALVRSRVPIAVFPAGTVNDLAFELEMKPDWSWLGESIRQNNSRPFLLLEINGLPVAVYGAVGIAAVASRKQHLARSWTRPFRKAFPTLQTPFFTIWTALFGKYVRDLRLTLDGRILEVRTSTMCILNQGRLNRRVDLEWSRPKGSRQFRIICFKPTSRFNLVRTISRLQKTKRLGAIRDQVDIYDVDEAMIESVDGHQVGFIADGEPGIAAKSLELRVSDRQLMIFRKGAS